MKFAYALSRLVNGKAYISKPAKLTKRTNGKPLCLQIHGFIEAASKANLQNNEYFIWLLYLQNKTLLLLCLAVLSYASEMKNRKI